MSGSMFMAWLVIAGCVLAEQAERVNAAADLLEAGMPAAEAARVLAARLGVSARQARRYADQARASGRAEVPEASVVFTVELPRGAGGAGAGARA